MSNDIAMVVISCDKYSAAWPAFAHGLQKYWPDCPYKIYFVTGFRDAPIGNSIKVGADLGWSNNILNALGSIKESILLMMVEDYWLYENIDTSVVEQLVELVRSGKADQIRLNKSAEAWESDHPFPTTEPLDIIPNTAFYIASLQPSIWRKAYLKNFIRPNENVWQFEQRGGERILADSRNYSTKRPIIPFWQANPIQGGKWTNDAKTYAEREGITIDTSIDPKDCI